MPHSSGGGSHGGGFHGGSGFHGGGLHGHTGSHQNYIRHSRHYFPGAYRYYYYLRGMPHIIYSSARPGTTSKFGEWFSVFLFFILTIVPPIVLISQGFKNPKPLATNYDTTIVIADEGSALSSEQTLSMQSKFLDFRSLTGITPAFLSVDPTYSVVYKSDDAFERHAYYEYLDRFNDEKHWLLVYMGGEDWKFVGMQGNDTDDIITYQVATTFAKNVVTKLEQNVDITTAINSSFDLITPGLMNKSYHLDSTYIVGTAFFTLFSGLMFGVSICNLKNAYTVGKSKELPKDSILKNCPYCDSPYYSGTVKTCPKCGAPLDDDEPAKEETIKEDNPFDDDADRFAIDPEQYK